MSTHKVLGFVILVLAVLVVLLVVTELLDVWGIIAISDDCNAAVISSNTRGA